MISIKKEEKDKLKKYFKNNYHYLSIGNTIGHILDSLIMGNSFHVR